MPSSDSVSSPSFHTSQTILEDSDDDDLAGDISLQEREQRDVAVGLRTSDSETFYNGVAGWDKKVLVCMCLGQLTDDGRPLIDLEQPPWLLEPTKTVKPTNKELVAEVIRRQKILDPTDRDKHFPIRPKNKSREELVAWLTKYPIEDLLCRCFLSKEVGNVVEILQKAQEESQAINDAMKNGAWYGGLPYLRLLHCITDLDHCKKAFLRRNESMERQELDAQGTPNAPPNAYDIIADAWNDVTFNPWTRPSACHSTFRNPIKLHHCVVEDMTPADGIKIKNVLSTIRANLLRVIQNWEQSGQGDGGRILGDDDDDDADDVIPVEPASSKGWGSIEGRPQQALDSRENFLNGLHEWYLYFWEQVDKFQLLTTCLQRFSDVVVAGDGGEVARDPTLSGRKKQKTQPSESSRSTENTGELAELTDLLANVAQNARLSRVQQRELAYKQLESDEYHRVNNKQLFYLSQVAETEKEMEIAEEKLHTTKDDFYRNVIDKKKRKLDELHQILNNLVALVDNNE